MHCVCGRGGGGVGGGLWSFFSLKKGLMIKNCIDQDPGREAAYMGIRDLL